MWWKILEKNIAFFKQGMSDELLSHAASLLSIPYYENVFIIKKLQYIP